MLVVSYEVGSSVVTVTVIARLFQIS